MAILDGAKFSKPMGEKDKELLKLQSDKRLGLEFHRIKFSSDAGLWPVEIYCRTPTGGLTIKYQLTYGF